MGVLTLKENIISLIHNPEITAERISETFSISNLDYNKLAKEICEYFSDVYSDDQSNREKFGALVNAYYDIIIRVLDKTISRIDSLQFESKIKFSEIYNAKLRFDKLFYNYYEVYIADYSYHNIVFLSDKKEKKIEDKREHFIATLNKKLSEFCNDERLSTVINMRIIAKETIANRKNEIKKDTENEQEYYRLIADDRIIKCAESEVSCYNDAIDAFLFIMSFDESYNNNIDEEKEKIYRKVYIKRRIHQFTFKKEEMYQYFIRPFLTFEENSSLVKEIYEDIGYFIPTHGGNMKKLFYAYYDLCLYETNKLLFSLCSTTADTPNKANCLYNAYQNSDNINKMLKDVYYRYTNNYQKDDKASELVYDSFSKITDKIKKHFNHKVKLLYPETIELYDRIEELYSKIKHSSSIFNLFEAQTKNQNEDIYNEIDKTNATILDFVKSQQ